MKSDDKILEEFNHFKKEYTEDPIFTLYQMHKTIEVLVDFVNGSIEATKKEVQS